jgi:hypothetical protein
MTSKPHIEVTKEREVNTYAEMWHTSLCLLEKGQEDQEGCFHQWMGSLVFTAFTLEAYLNHIGPNVITCWNDVERIGPKEKLNIIAELLKVDINYGSRPWQVMKHLFGFRNDLAHGKSKVITTNEIMPAHKYSDAHLGKPVQTEWEKYCTLKNAQEAREDVEKIVRSLHAAGKFENDYPFSRGFHSHGATLIAK